MNSPSSPDDEQTVIRTGAATTGSGRTTGGADSDFAPSSTYWATSLPEGLRLGEYEIKNVIGEGGFGIVYLAWDHFLQRQVALKEYMPSSLAARSRTGLEVVVKSERHRETFEAGLRSFVNEARLLAQFDHPALVKVYRFWEANGTAYMVMPYVVGPTLKHALAQLGKPPSEAWLRDSLLHPLLGAIGLLHKAQCLHRDIAPDNILLTETGPLLLDFGAARQIIGDLSKSLTVVLKPGYAPIEQYGEVDSLAQGPWTDVYALAGVVRYSVTGKVPPSATGRLINDTMKPLAEELAGRYSESFLKAVDAALAVRPEQRPQDVWAFQALLDDGLEPEITTASPTLPVALDDEEGAPSQWPPAGPRTGRGTTTTGRTGWRTTTSPATRGPQTAGATQAPGLGGQTVPGGTWGQPGVESPTPSSIPAPGTTVAALHAPAPIPAAPPASAAGGSLPQPAPGAPAPQTSGSAKAVVFGAAAAVLALAVAGGAWWAMGGKSASGSGAAGSAAQQEAGNREGATTPGAAAPPAVVPAGPGASASSLGQPATVGGSTAPLTGATPEVGGAQNAAAPQASAQPSATTAPTPAPGVASSTGSTAPSPLPGTPPTSSTASPAAPPAGARVPASALPSENATGRALPQERVTAGRPAPRATAAPTAPATPRDASANASPARVETGGNRAARCSDILQKASLEPLTPSETAFLRSECK